MNEFNIGDRVVCLVDNPEGNSHIFAGSAGVVCRILDESRVGVDWGEPVSTHGCDGRCPRGQGWYINTDSIAPEGSDEPFEFDEREFNKLIFGEG